MANTNLRNYRRMCDVYGDASFFYNKYGQNMALPQLAWVEKTVYGEETG